MRRTLLTTMVAALILAVICFAAELPVIGFALVSCGFTCLANAVRNAQPKHWTRADNDQEQE